MAFKSIGGLATRLVGDALEAKSGQPVRLLDYFNETISSVHDAVLRQDPDAPDVRMQDLGNPAEIVAHVTDAAILRVLDGRNSSPEAALAMVCDTWWLTVGRPLPHVTHSNGDFDRCMSLKF